MKRRLRPADAWQVFSYSKLRALFNCPFQFQQLYVLRTVRPTPPILAVGSALHYLAHLHNKRPYKSAATFAGAWRGFWAGVLSGKHGPDSFRSLSQPIAWKSEEEARSWYGQGSKILAGYFERHREWRGTLGSGVVVGCKSEYRMNTRWRGFKLVGVMDRIDEYPEWVDIVDLKMGKEDPVLAASSFQPVFYQIGYEQQCRQRYFSGKPLRYFVIENLITGVTQILSPGGTERLQGLASYLAEASGYIRAILTQDSRLSPALTHLHPQDLEHLRFFPRLPRGLHCRNCAFTVDCRQWEDDHGPVPHDLWVERFASAMAQAQPQQLALPLG